MNGLGAWETVRHVVRVCGRVADQQGMPLRGVAVALWSAPEPDAPNSPGSPAAQAGSGLCALLDQTETRPDGFYFFLDCPAGDFVAQAFAVGPRRRGVTSFRVGAHAEGKVQIAVADITVAAARPKDGDG